MAALDGVQRSFTQPVPAQREAAFARAGIEAFQGRARFVGPQAVQVGAETLEGRYVLVATGQKPAPLPIPGAEYLTTSDSFLELDELPHARIVLIGGGYIGFEFAHIAARAGAQVTVLHRGERALPRFEPELVDLLVEHTQAIGVRVHLRAEAQAVERGATGYVVSARVDGEPFSFPAAMVVHAAGRVPELDDLGLDAAGVEWDRRGVKVNEYLQSVSNPSVYAAGDAAATPGPPLTPVAGYEGAIVAANLLDGNHRQPDYRGIPTVVFTIPPLAAVGLTEPQARTQGLRFRVQSERTTGWYSSRRIAEPCSAYKVLVEEDTGRILGAHLLGAEAAEIINLFALAIRLNLTASDLKALLYSYPSHASDVPYML